MSVAYTPQQNWVARRMNRRIKENARTLLLGIIADEKLWVDAVLTVAYLTNLMSVFGSVKTPHNTFYGTAPDVSHLRVWGCLYIKA